MDGQQNVKITDISNNRRGNTSCILLAPLLKCWRMQAD